MIYEPRIGDYGCVKTNGFFGWLIRLGTFSRWNHCFIYVGDGEIIGADPQGVKKSPLSNYTNVAWNQHEELTDKQRDAIFFYTHQALGKPYNFFTIADLALRILGLKILANTWLAKKLATTQGYICSELVSEVYKKAGVDLCHKEDYLVVPGDLAERLIWQ